MHHYVLRDPPRIRFKSFVLKSPLLDINVLALGKVVHYRLNCSILSESPRSMKLGDCCKHIPPCELILQRLICSLDQESHDLVSFVGQSRPVLAHDPGHYLQHGVGEVLLEHLEVDGDGRVAELVPIDLFLIVTNALDELIR